jgi:HB1, ASXL, restriction endonuclease HTH domain
MNVINVGKDRSDMVGAIREALNEAGEALPYREITELIIKFGTYTFNSRTPATSVNTAINLSLLNPDTPFIKGDIRGVYGLKNYEANSGQPQAAQGKSSSNREKGKAKKDTEGAGTSNSLSKSIINCYGIYWRSELVNWGSNPPKILGKQIEGNTANQFDVDFGAQIGVYILYDRHKVIYAGQTTAGAKGTRGLGIRLKEHRSDRLGGRWDRFSWFGLLPVADDAEGKLSDDKILTLDSGSIISTFEALLIEVLEVSHNRQSGDFLEGLEYIQSKDADIAKKNKRNIEKARDILEKIQDDHDI